MKAFSFSCAVFSDRGARRKNEDNFYFLGQWRRDGADASPFEAAGRRDGAVLAAVFDGMGGESEGDFASRAAAEALDGFASRLLDAPAERLERIALDYFNTANGRICQHSLETGRRCGSTASLLLLRETSLYAWNIGDSRIFRLRGGELSQISQDDTEYARMRQIGGFDADDPKYDRLRSRLTQYLGMPPEEVRLSPHMTVLPFLKGDRYLLCSDGLTEGMDREELRRLLDADKPPSAVAKTLAAAAVQAGSHDNVTALLLQAEAAEGVLSRFVHKRRNPEGEEKP